LECLLYVAEQNPDQVDEWWGKLVTKLKMSYNPVTPVENKQFQLTVNEAPELKLHFVKLAITAIRVSRSYEFPKR